MFQVTAKNQLIHFWCVKISIISKRCLILVQDFTDMCKRGGSKSTKLISNKKDVMFQIPDSLRTDGVKEKDLTGGLSIERA